MEINVLSASTVGRFSDVHQWPVLGVHRGKEAIEGYLESLVKDGEPIPADKEITLEPVKEQIRIALPEPA